MTSFAMRTGIAGALLLGLSQAVGEPAEAQHHGGGGGRYGAIGRDADSVFLLDQQDGTIYRCPTNYVGRCSRQSWIQ